MTSFDVNERGYFWWADVLVPDNHFAPDNAVTGLIQVSSDGTIKLILDDFLPRDPGRPSLDPGVAPAEEPQLAVVGLIKRGQEYVRLEQLSHVGMSVGSAERASETIRARMCVRGKRLVAHLPPNRYCESMRLSLAGFEEWLQLRHPRVEESETETSARVLRPAEEEFELHDAIIAIGVDVTSHSEDLRLEVSLRQEGYLTYTPRSLMTLEEVSGIASKIEDLLVLLTGCERTLGLPQVKIGGADDWNEVSYRIIRGRQKEIARSDLWTTFPHLKSNFGEIAKAWFAKSTEFGPGFYMYLGNRRGARLYIEHRFASLEAVSER